MRNRRISYCRHGKILVRVGINPIFIAKFSDFNKMLQEEPHQCSGSGDGDSQEIYEEEDCECETEQLVNSASDSNNNLILHL